MNESASKLKLVVASILATFGMLLGGSFFYHGLYGPGVIMTLLVFIGLADLGRFKITWKRKTIILIALFLVMLVLMPDPEAMQAILDKQ